MSTDKHLTVLDEDSSRIIRSSDRKLKREPTKQRNVLVIEDDVVDFRSIERHLNKVDDVDYIVERADRLADGLKRLEAGGIHVVLLDLGLPDSQGLETFQKAQCQAPHLPIIVLTGVDDESVAAQMVNEGAADYLVKSKIDSDTLVRSIGYARGRHNTQKKLRQVLLLAQAAEANLLSVLNNNLDGVIVIDNQGIVLFSNTAARGLFGRTESELHAQPFGFPLTTAITELELLQPGGGQVSVEMRIVRTEWESNPAWLAMLHDLTARKLAEAEHARLAAIVNSTGDAIVSVDLDGKLLTWNSAAEKMFGYSANEAIGKDASILWPADEREHAADMLENIKRGETVSERETVRVHKDGRGIDVSLSVSSIRNTQGDIVSIAGIIRDITERKQAEEELRFREERFRSITESANDAIVLAGSDSKIISWNAAAETIFGYCEEEMLGQPLTTLMPERYHERHVNGFERYANTGEARVVGQTVELEGLRKDGSEFPLELSLSAWKVAEGQFYCGIIRDITERKRAEVDRHEIRIASEMQESLFPSDAPSLTGFDIAGAVYPAARASGDYFDFIPMANETVGLVAGDVSGHGLGPAMMMVQTRAYLRSLIRTHDDPGEILTETNQLLLPNDSGRFLTLIFCRLDPQTRSFTYASAGHTGYLLNQNGDVTTLDSTGMVLGVLADQLFTSAPAISLQPGDLMLLPTDGIHEAHSPGKELFGVERTLDVVRANREKPANEIVEALYQAAREFSDGRPQDDDITAVVIKVQND